MEHPHKWVVITVEMPDGEIFDRVLAGWQGGYLDGDAWKISSKIVEVNDVDDEFVFKTKAGNEYICRKTGYGTTIMMLSKLDEWSRSIPMTINKKYEQE